MNSVVGSPGFHRAHFLDVLDSHLDGTCVTTHFSKRLATYSQAKGSASPIQLIFTDGSTATADILIGCDGIKSTVRRTMLELASSRLEATGTIEDLALAARLRDAIEPIWSGLAVYRGIVSSEMVKATHPETRALSKAVNVSLWHSSFLYF